MKILDNGQQPVAQIVQQAVGRLFWVEVFVQQGAAQMGFEGAEV